MSWESELDTKGRRAEEALGVIRKTWQHWILVGGGLQAGREWAMHQTGTNQTSGKAFNVKMGEYLQKYNLHTINKAARSRMLQIMDNIHVIEEWRAGLTETQRLNLNHPDSVLRQWKKATTPPKTKDAEPKETYKDKARNFEDENHRLKTHIAELEAGGAKAESIEDLRLAYVTRMKELHGDAFQEELHAFFVEIEYLSPATQDAVDKRIAKRKAEKAKKKAALKLTAREKKAYQRQMDKARCESDIKYYEASKEDPEYRAIVLACLRKNLADIELDIKELIKPKKKRTKAATRADPNCKDCHGTGILDTLTEDLKGSFHPSVVKAPCPCTGKSEFVEPLTKEEAKALRMEKYARQDERERKRMEEVGAAILEFLEKEGGVVDDVGKLTRGLPYPAATITRALKKLREEKKIRRSSRGQQPALWNLESTPAD